MDIYKILAICFISAVLAVILKQYKLEYAFSVSIAAGVIIIIYIISSVYAPIQTIKKSIEDFGIDTEYFKIALKALIIGYITNFVADACRDSGQVSMATKAELAGKCSIFILSIPLILSVLQTALGFIK